MTKLIDTWNICRFRNINVNDTELTEITAFGDGNCAFNAFALGIIHLTKKDLLLTPDNAAKLERFAKYVKRDETLQVLKKRLKQYGFENGVIIDNNAKYNDIAPQLHSFIQFVESTQHLTIQSILNYIKQHANSRHDIAALQVALAYPLRLLSADDYLQSGEGIFDKDMLEDAKNLKNDGAYAGKELLQFLSQCFDIKITYYQSKNEADDEVIKVTGNDNPANTPDAQEIKLLYKEDHWNYLIPADQDNGIALLLPTYSVDPPEPKAEQDVDTNNNENHDFNMFDLPDSMAKQLQTSAGYLYNLSCFFCRPRTDITITTIDHNPLLNRLGMVDDM